MQQRGTLLAFHTMVRHDRQEECEQMNETIRGGW
jgi:hypothetical protein